LPFSGFECEETFNVSSNDHLPFWSGVQSISLSLKSLFNLLFSFFSTYAGQDILDVLADALCPTFFPPGQECTLPLNPGQYGSLVGGPLDFTLPDLPDILSKYTDIWVPLLRIIYKSAF
jgi:hypothetical protein